MKRKQAQKTEIKKEKNLSKFVVILMAMPFFISAFTFFIITSAQLIFLLFNPRLNHGFDGIVFEFLLIILPAICIFFFLITYFILKNSPIFKYYLYFINVLLIIWFIIMPLDFIVTLTFGIPSPACLLYPFGLYGLKQALNQELLHGRK